MQWPNCGFARTPCLISLILFNVPWNMKFVWVAALVPDCLLVSPLALKGFLLSVKKAFGELLTQTQKTSQLVLLADLFFLHPFFFHVSSNYQTKHSEKALLGEAHQRKLCDTHQVRHTVHRAWLTLWSHLEKKVVLLGHWYLASHCGWRWLTQPETNRLSMRVQTTPQQMLN